tara:strand:- start:3729 stop:4391 length:663 start_codon:yes stop_codon:yes gene_type:complete
MAAWKNLALVNDDGTLGYDTSGYSAGLLDGHLLAQANGGTNADLSTGSGLLQKNQDGTVSLFTLPALDTDHVLKYNSGGTLGWIGVDQLAIAPEGDFVQTNDSIELGNVTVSGTLNVDGGAIIMGAEDLTTTSNRIKLNADGTTPQAGDKFGFIVDCGTANDPEFYWDYDGQEFRWQGHGNTDEHVVATSFVSGTPPVSANGGDIHVDSGAGGRISIYVP